MGLKRFGLQAVDWEEWGSASSSRCWGRTDQACSHEI